MMWIILIAAVAMGASEGLLIVEDNKQQKIRINDIVEGTEHIQGER